MVKTYGEARIDRAGDEVRWEKTVDMPARERWRRKSSKLMTECTLSTSGVATPQQEVCRLIADASGRANRANPSTACRK